MSSNEAQKFLNWNGEGMLYAVALVILILLFGLLVIRHLNKKMVMPINAIADAVQNSLMI